MDDKRFQEFVVSVRAANDIVGVVSNHTPLKKSGRSFSGNCPFHLEKSPSFFVNPEKQFFNCFGCQVGGDVIKFVSMVENISFKEALIKLARLQGIEIPAELIRQDPGAERNTGIYGLLSDATSYYMKVISSAGEESSMARNYLYSRGLTNDDIDRYLIGYALASPAKFVNAVVKSRRYNVNELEQAGMVVRGRDGNYYDRFFGRIMFPIMDRSGRTIGFGGRTINPESTPKYLNSPETAVYKKNMVFYGVNHAHDAIIKKKEAILVEGYFDFIALHRSGFQNCLATCGTALSPYHVKYLENNKVEHIYLLFDMDEAGVRATMKNFELLSKTEIKVSVIKFEGAKDADEFIKAFGPVKMQETIDAAQPFTRFLIEFAYNKFGRGDIEAKTAIINFLVPHFRSMASDITRNQYFAMLSQELGISEDGIRDLTFRNARQAAAAGPDRGAPQTTIDIGTILAPEKNVKRRAQLDILHLIMQNVDYLSQFLTTVDFEKVDCPELREVVELMLASDNFTITNDLPALLSNTKHADFYAKLYAMPLNIENVDRYFDDISSRFINILRRERIEELNLKIRESEAVGDIEASKALLLEVAALQKETASETVQKSMGNQ